MTIINPLTYNIANGQAIDATPVMADLNQIVSNVNANAVASASLAASGGAGLVGYSQGVPGSKTSGTTGSQLDNLSASGATASRPTPAFLGQPYFDTTLGQPIWCSSLLPVMWVNAAGVSV